MARQFGGWSWDSHSHIVKTQLSRNQGKLDNHGLATGRRAVQEEPEIEEPFQ